MGLTSEKLSDLMSELQLMMAMSSSHGLLEMKLDGVTSYGLPLNHALQNFRRGFLNILPNYLQWLSLHLCESTDQAFRKNFNPIVNLMVS